MKYIFSIAAAFIFSSCIIQHKAKEDHYLTIRSHCGVGSEQLKKSTADTPYKKIWVVAEWTSIDGGYHIAHYTVDDMENVIVTKTPSGKLYRLAWVEDPKGDKWLYKESFVGSQNICRVRQLTNVYLK